jgi:hypothetical protein
MRNQIYDHDRDFEGFVAQISIDSGMSIDDVKRKSEWFVLLPWSEYHDLSACPLNVIVTRTSKEAFDMAESHLDRVYGPLYGPLSLDDANKLMTAFKDLCYADWSPNQTVQDRSENAKLAQLSRKVIGEFSLV